MPIQESVPATVEQELAELRARVAELEAQWPSVRSAERADERFRVAADALGAVIYETDAETGLVLSSYGMERMLGYTPPPGRTREWYLGLVHEDDRARVREHPGKPGARYQFQYRIRHREGYWLVVEDTGQYVPATGSLPARRIGAIVDITRRKQTEEQMVASERRLRLATQAAGMGWWDNNTNPEHSIWSDQQFALLGYDPASQKPGRQAWLERVHPDDRDMAIREVQRAQQTGQPYNCTHRIIRADNGEVRWLDAHGVFIDGAGGPRSRSIGVAWDVTETKEAEAALRDSEVRFRQLFEQNPLPSIIYDGAGKPLRWNAAFEQMWSVTPEALPEGYSIWTDPGLLETGVLDCLRRAYAGEVVQIPTIFYSPQRVASSAGGRGVWVRAVAYPFYGPLGDVEGIVVIQENVTEALEADRALREREAELASVFEATPVGIALLDRDWRFVQINASLARMNGKTVAEHLGRHITEILGPRGEKVYEQVGKVLSTGEAVRDLEVVSKPDDPGPPWAYLAHFVPVRSQSGEVFGVCCVVADITARKQLEEALRQREAEFRQIADRLPHLSWVTDRTGMDLWFNARWYAYTGATEAESLADVWQFFHPEDAARARAAWQRSLETGEVYQVEYRCRRHDGVLRWHLGRAEPVRDEQGRILRWFGTCTDIHDQRVLRDELHFRKEQLQVALAAGDLGTYLLRFDDQSVEWDQRTRQISGHESKPDSSYAWAMASVVHPDDRAAVEQGLARATDPAGDGLYRVEHRIIRPDGEVRWVSANGRVTFDDQGRPQFLTGTSLDITDRRQADEVLRRSNEDLERFASMASHDLQEPLRHIGAYAQLLQAQYQGELGAAGNHYLSVVLNGVRRMQRLTRDLLDFARVGEQNEPVDYVSCEEALAAARAGLTTALETSHAELSWDALPRVLANGPLLAQVFQNLISNAVKYARPGIPPVIRVSAERRRHHWVIAVRDNGQGIALAHQSRVFGLFERLHGVDVSGTGLGLALCKRLIERWGGEIWVDSVPGVGSTFRFTLQGD